MADSFFDEVLLEYEIANDDEKAKTIYATYGMVCFWCQCIEESFALMLIGVRIVKRKLTSINEVNAVIDKIENSKATMGNLHNEVIQEYRLPESFGLRLKNILDRRNFIVHKFFKANSSKWYSDSGKVEMLNLLASFVEEAKKVDGTLQQYYDSYFQALGIDDSLVEKTLEKMKLEEASRD